MITKIFKILGPILLIMFTYALILIVFPGFWAKVDNFTWTKISSSYMSIINNISNKFSWIKDDTDTVIDWVWTNTKNRSKELQDNLNDMKSN